MHLKTGKGLPKAVSQKGGKAMVKNRSNPFANRSFFTVFISFLLLAPITASAASFNTTVPTVVDDRYKIQILVPGSHFHGIHGITFDSRDNLYVGSVVGQSVYKVDPDTGEVTEFIGPPDGMADDLEFGPDGRLYYTSYLMGQLRAKSADGQPVILAKRLMGLNSLAFNQDGRLFATQVFLGDALYEMDLTGQTKPRQIAKGLGGLNGFDFGPDNKLYGPLWFKGVVARVDVETGQIEVVAKGFHTPAAVNFDSKGNLFAIDTALGQVIQVDVKTGQKKLIAKVNPSIDNLAIDSKDRIFITNMAQNGVYEIDKATGKARTVVEGKISCAAGVAIFEEAEGDVLYLADVFSYKKVDGFTGEVTILMASHAEGSHISYPTSISVTGNDVLLIGSSTGTIQVIDRKSNHEKVMMSGFESPGHALMMPDGGMIVAEMASGKLLRVTGEKGKDRAVKVEGLKAPGYLAPAGPNSVYVTEIATGSVLRIDLTNGDKKVIATGLQSPEGLGVLPDGKLAVVEGITRQLVEVDPINGNITPLVTNLAIGFPPGGRPPGILTGVAVSRSGAIYVTADIENALYKIMPK